MTDNNKDLNIHGHISINAEAARVLNQGMQAATSNIGLAGTITGVATAVGKAVVKSGMPPLQKAGAIVGSGIAAGLGHTLLSTINRKTVRAEDAITVISSSTETN